MLTSEVITVFSATKSLPNRISHILTESTARDFSVTEPMKGLSENFMCA